MFESIISAFLTKYLQEFVDNFDPSKLNISLTGYVLLQNLHFKKNALADILNIPVTVAHGWIGKLELNVPLTKLISSPVIAEISDLYLVLRPRKADQWNDEEENRISQNLKQKKLAAFTQLQGRIWIIRI